MRSTSHTLGRIGLLLLALLVGVLGLGSWINATQAQVPPSPLDQMRPVGRDRLAICVQAAAGVALNTGEARSAVEKALASLTTNPKWVPYGYGKAPAIVDVGCPTVGPAISNRPAGNPTLPVAMATALAGYPSTVGGARTVDEPAKLTKYTVFLFVLPAPEIAIRFKGTTAWTPRTEAWETLCTGGCVVASTALFVGRDELIDQILMASLLEQTLWLQPDPPALPPGVMPTRPPGVVDLGKTPTPGSTPIHPWLASPGQTPVPWRPHLNTPVPTQHVPRPQQTAAPAR